MAASICIQICVIWISLRSCWQHMTFWFWDRLIKRCIVITLLTTHFRELSVNKSKSCALNLLKNTREFKNKWKKKIGAKMTCFFSQNQKHWAVIYWTWNCSWACQFSIGKKRSSRWQSSEWKNILTKKQKAKFYFRMLCFSQIVKVLAITSKERLLHVVSEDIVSGLEGSWRLFRQAFLPGFGSLPPG